MTTFFLAALDDRIAASAAVVGNALHDRLDQEPSVRGSLRLSVYPVNSYGLLYSEVGALIAPRPQLLANADADRGFPMDSFTEMVDKMQDMFRISMAGASALQTAVAPGGHTDTEAIRIPASRSS